MQMTFSQD